jgi:eukaryotic-like serine/threonine-protein kinase
MSALETLGKHEIRRRLGRGAVGTVYEGWDPIIQRRVAIKTVRLPEADDDETAEEIARFRREAQAAGGLNHPNIVGVFDYGETADLAYIVMEYVDGPSLKSLLDKHERFSLPRIVRIMEDLLSGLQYSHERGVVHRDIKPANLMLTSSGQGKIADFGIARIESSSMTQAGTVLGTPAYMSPEQFMGQVVDARSDIYSSGVLLFQLLTGERPFDGSMSSIMQKALQTEAPPPSRISMNVPLPFDAVVARAMAKRPEDRYSSANEFLAAIHTAAAECSPNEEAPDQDVEATVITRPRSPTPTIGSGSRPATARADPFASVLSTRSADPPKQPVAPAGGGRGATAKKGFGWTLVIGAGFAGLAVVAGAGYFLVSEFPALVPVFPTAAVAPANSVRQPVASTPPETTPRSNPAPPPGPVVLNDPATPSMSQRQPAANPPPAAASGAPPSPNAAVVPVVPPPVVAPPVLVPPVVAPPVVTPPVVAFSPPDVKPPADVQPPPIQPPALPSPPIIPSPVERLRLMARSLPCSALNVTGAQDGMSISGVAAQGRELDRLLAEARSSGQVTDEIVRPQRFACAPITTVAALARQSWEIDPRPLSLSLDHQDILSGAQLGIDAGTTLPVVYIDLYRDNGEVRHLTQPVSASFGDNPHTASVVAPAPGPGLIVAIGATTQLELGTRPETERTGDYLAALQVALRNAAFPPAVDLTMITVRPAERVPPAPRPVAPAVGKINPPGQVIQRPRPTEPAVAGESSQHQPVLRSAKCSNILSRAQLGENLSNDEIAALRTECRS